MSAFIMVLLVWCLAPPPVRPLYGRTIDGWMERGWEGLREGGPSLINMPAAAPAPIAPTTYPF